jgi:hypothetical protein
LENVAGLLESNAAQPTAIDVDDLVANLQTAIPAKSQNEFISFE